MSTQIEIDKKLTKYLQEIGYRSDKIIDELVAETLALGNVARMQIAPEQGQFLEIIVKISQAKNCLEIGRFTGLSSLCIAKGLPENGKLVAIDNSDEFLLMAEQYWKMAEVDSKIESIIADGLQAMQSMVDRQHFFDFIFIDADKNNYLDYYKKSIELVKKGGIILIDNTIWKGKVMSQSDHSKSTESIRKLNNYISVDDRVNHCILAIYDGMTLCIKK